MCNRVSAPEFREIKIRWNLFNDLPEFKRSHNVAPSRGDMLAIVQSPVAELSKGDPFGPFILPLASPNPKRRPIGNSSIRHKRMVSQLRYHAAYHKEVS